MTGSEIKEFFKLYAKMDNLAEEIFSKFKEADLLSLYIVDPIYKEMFIDLINENLVITYCNYDETEYDDTLTIPSKVIYDNKIDEYIGNIRKEREEFLKRIKQEDIERQLEEERAEYERLKAKFENE